ncbi:MAG: dicarboxylate/amino acid:cation symporter [Saprospiraceae bacterium]|nr:dicarboxylate/amino acid:cation symporter [Saprospiraceae bacterium]
MHIRIALHWQILLGLALGVLVGFLAVSFGWINFIRFWIKPFGTIFINALKMIAVPLILVSLIKGVSDLKDLTKLSQMGIRTVGWYLLTTVTSVTLGLVIVNIFQPGYFIEPDTREILMQSYGEGAQTRIGVAQLNLEKGPLQPLVDIFPDNVISALTDNTKMLQAIVIAIFFGIGLILLPAKTARPLKNLFDGLNDVVMKMVDIIMLLAPYGAFALLAALIIDAPSLDLIGALLSYSGCVVIGILILLAGLYPMLVSLLTKMNYKTFWRAIFPAQLVGFSTSSSAATLPVTMERTKEHLGVDEEVASFVLPIGATVNMDGTSLYQAVAAVFIAQAMGITLDLAAQLGILLTATLASIGAAAVPGAGMIMLVIVLGAAGIPEAGLALIIAVDRPLDMLRTTANVTSDACIAVLVASRLGKLKTPIQ